MEALFGGLLQMTLMASVAVLVVLAARILIKNRLPAIFSHALWALVLLRLLLPVSLPSPVSIFNAVPQQTREMVSSFQQEDFFSPGAGATAPLAGALPPAADPVETPPGPGNVISGENTLEYPPSGEGREPAKAPSAGIFTYLSWMWLAGALGMLIFFVTLYFRAVARFSTAVRFEGGGLPGECARRLGLRREVGVFLSDRTDSPVVCGLTRPRIILPYEMKKTENPRHLRYILTHEMVHIKRLDYVFKPLFLLALSLHWFNPLVWLAVFLSDKDLELSCDEKVMTAWEGDVRGEYAESLLAISARQNGLGGMLDGGLLAFGETGIKSRVKNVLRFRRPALRLSVLGVAAVLLLTACLATGPSRDEGLPEDLTQVTGTAVTDEAAINKLWDDYFYFAITGLQQDFTDPGQLDIWALVSYATDQFFVRGDTGSLELMEWTNEYGDAETVMIWPYEDVAAYIKQYFNYEVTDYDVFKTFESMNAYGPYPGTDESVGLLIPVGAESRYSGIQSMSENPWSFYIEKAMETKDGSLLVQLSTNQWGTDLVETRRHYLMKPREDGSYYFSALQYQYVNNHLAGFSEADGAITYLEDIGFVWGGATLMGESADSLYFYGTGRGSSGDNVAQFRRVSKETGAITAQIDQEVVVDTENNVGLTVQIVSDGFLIKGSEAVVHLDYDLKVTVTQSIPQAIRDKMHYVYNPDTNRNTQFFNGYCVTGDFSTWFFSYEEGLWRYNAADESLTLLVAPEYGTGRLMEGAIITPTAMQLVLGERKLTYVTYSYEGLGGVYCLDLATGQTEPMPLTSSYGGLSGSIYGVGHTVGNADVGPPLTMEFYSYETGRIRSVEVPVPLEIDRTVDALSFDMAPATGRLYSAAGLYVYKNVNKDDGETSYYLYRLRHADMTVERVDFTVDVRYATCQVYGVTDEGRILLWYYVSPGEQGFILAG